MPFISEAARQRREETIQDWKSGKITRLEAGTLLVEAEPDMAGGYLLLGDEYSDAGDPVRAEPLYWKGLERLPCHHHPYFALAECRRRQNAGDPVATRLMQLGIWKLASSTKIPDEIAEYFAARMPKAKFDFKDPEIYEALALGLESDECIPDEPDERLRPYELLHRFLRQAGEGYEAVLMETMLSETSIPLWRAGLRQWTDESSALTISTTGLLAALLGETAGPEILDDLLDMTDINEPTIRLHATWALWRLGNRFPAEVLAGYRAAAGSARLAVRCAMADQISLLPETAGEEECLEALLQGFADFAQDQDAAYLLTVVRWELEQCGHEEQARAIAARYESLLSQAGHDWIREFVNDQFEPNLIQDDIEDLTLEEIWVDRILEAEEEEDLEDEDEAIHPVVKPPMPGRNDPCWCGSGKKYKKCHLAADGEEERAEHARGHGELSEAQKLYDNILDCSMEWHNASESLEARRLYFGSPVDVDRIPDHKVGGFIEWYIHDFRSGFSGRTLVEEYRRRRAGSLSTAAREMLDSWRVARFGMFEVQNVEEGKGVELKDVFTGDQFFVHDVSCSHSMVRWDCVLTRVSQQGGLWYFVGNGLGIPRPLMPKLIEQVERERQGLGKSAAEFFGANSHRWHRVMDEIAEEQLAGLRVVNAEGDELEFCAAEYRVTDDDSLVAALAQVKEFEAEPSDEPGVRSFAWLDPGNEDARRSHGRLEIRDGKLRLECRSRTWLAIGRQLIEQHGGAHVQHVRDTFQSLDDIKRKVAKGGRRGKMKTPPSGISPDLERELILEMKTKHYAGWADESLPALGGQTPRQASQSESGRRALEDLLRDMENGEERRRKEGAAAFDFSAIRKSLGM